MLNFLSMFIVLPRLSESPTLYGVYSLCIATVIFLSYTDFGFLGASYKYASESYACRNLQEEIAVMGFAYFVLLVFTSLFSLTAIAFALHPGLIIRDVSTPSEQEVARSLFLILSASAFIIVTQRWVQVIFGVRLEDYR